MAHLEFSSVIRESGLVLTKDEAKILLPILKRAVKIERGHVEHYQDILEGGDATDRQQDLLMKHEEKEEKLSQVLDYAQRLVKSK